MASKCIQSKCCICIIKGFQWLPVVFIVAIIMWSYYAYVFALCFFTIDSTVQKVFYLVFYHAAVVMFMWAYYQTIFTPIGRVPDVFKLTREQADIVNREESEDKQRQLLARTAHTQNMPVKLRSMSGAIRYCEKCQVVKPDRAHHCSVCGECILKMDHHCPWVNNCVNFTNYKYFVLFLGYALIYCLYVASTSLQFFILFWTNDLQGSEKFHILFLFFVSIMFSISLVSLFSYHLYLTCMNRSTLESFRVPVFRTGPDKDGFYLGKAENFRQIFGDRRVLWFVPVFTTKGSGFNYHTRHSIDSYNSMGQTLDLRQDGNNQQPLTSNAGRHLAVNGDGYANGISAQFP